MHQLQKDWLLDSYIFHSDSAISLYPLSPTNVHLTFDRKIKATKFVQSSFGVFSNDALSQRLTLTHS